ncbi:hypothetical protein IX39_00240 [Chryseobacterium formosense]|uniref:Uncharacterized protein n=1 Tax=Chryseobacterium formosense TaxID=236814 RepID=A0A085Z3Z5_9FLAO|nr:hypothetical protein IX39_00240 [Chryseobacterium formosense]
MENFYKYVKNNLDGNYTAYIYNQDKLLYRYFLKIYKGDQKLITNQQIDQYLEKNKIKYEYLNKKDQKHAAFLLYKKIQKNLLFFISILNKICWKYI